MSEEKKPSVWEAALDKIDTEDKKDLHRFALEGLSEREMKFCIHYAKEANASKACLAAGWPKSSSRSEGSRLLKKPAIRNAINKLHEEKIKAASLDEDELIMHLRTVIKEGFEAGKLKEVNDAVKLLGQLIGKFGAASPVKSTDVSDSPMGFVDSDAQQEAIKQIAQLKKLSK